MEAVTQRSRSAERHLEILRVGYPRVVRTVAVAVAVVEAR